jgi:hypothetical protein
LFGAAATSKLVAMTKPIAPMAIQASFVKVFMADVSVFKVEGFAV